ncbi:MAG: HAD family hydrolase [Anaerolineae bacterium]
MTLTREGTSQPNVQEEAPHLDLTNLEGWFFDLDGTLMDTDDQAVEVLAKRLRFAGARRAERLARRLVMFSETPMNHMMTVMDWFGLDPWIFALRRWLSRQAKPTLRPIEGIHPVIARLSPQAQLAVVSTRSQADAMAFLRHEDLDRHFELVVTQETTKRLKPHPEPIQYAAQQMSLPPDHCVMVGDTTVDILAARRAGAWAIGVLCGFGEERELRRAGAHLVLASTADLLSFLPPQEPNIQDRDSPQVSPKTSLVDS